MTGIDFINGHLLRQESFFSTETAPQAQSSTEDNEDDFFFKETPTVASELELFLENHDTDLSIFNKFSKLRQIFVELNTPVPASAACERLLSCAGLLLRPHRCSMNDQNFENSLLVKLNKYFI